MQCCWRALSSFPFLVLDSCGYGCCSTVAALPLLPFAVALICRLPLLCQSAGLLRISNEVCTLFRCMRRYYNGHVLIVTEKTEEYLHVLLSPSSQVYMTPMSSKSASVDDGASVAPHNDWVATMRPPFPGQQGCRMYALVLFLLFIDPHGINMAMGLFIRPTLLDLIV